MATGRIKFTLRTLINLCTDIHILNKLIRGHSDVNLGLYLAAKLAGKAPTFPRGSRPTIEKFPAIKYTYRERLNESLPNSGAGEVCGTTISYNTFIRPGKSSIDWILPIILSKKKRKIVAINQPDIVICDRPDRKKTIIKELKRFLKSNKLDDKLEVVDSVHLNKESKATSSARKLFVLLIGAELNVFVEKNGYRSFYDLVVDVRINGAKKDYNPKLDPVDLIDIQRITQISQHCSLFSNSDAVLNHPIFKSIFDNNFGENNKKTYSVPAKDYFESLCIRRLSCDQTLAVKNILKAFNLTGKTALVTENPEEYVFHENESVTVLKATEIEDLPFDARFNNMIHCESRTTYEDLAERSFHLDCGGTSVSIISSKKKDAESAQPDLQAMSISPPLPTLSTMPQGQARDENTDVIEGYGKVLSDTTKLGMSNVKVQRDVEVNDTWQSKKNSMSVTASAMGLRTGSRRDPGVLLEPREPLLTTKKQTISYVNPVSDRSTVSARLAAARETETNKSIDIVQEKKKNFKKNKHVTDIVDISDEEEEAAKNGQVEITALTSSSQEEENLEMGISSNDDFRTIRQDGMKGDYSRGKEVISTSAPVRAATSDSNKDSLTKSTVGRGGRISSVMKSKPQSILIDKANNMDQFKLWFTAEGADKAFKKKEQDALESERLAAEMAEKELKQKNSSKFFPF